MVVPGHARCDGSVAAGGSAEVVECGASAGEELPVGEAAVTVTPKGAGGKCKLAATQRVQWAALRRGPVILLRQIGYGVSRGGSARRSAGVLVRGAVSKAGGK